MTYPEQYAIADTNDAPITRAPSPPLVELAVALHDVESELGVVRGQLRDLGQCEVALTEKRRAIRAKLSDLLEMSDHETRPTFG